MDFDKAFESLTGFVPMRWQARLFNRFVENDIPSLCDIPTGLGKTSVVVLWLLALVEQAESGLVQLPRRLVYIVNRRTVVDQATETVEQIRKRLLHPNHIEWLGHTSTLKAISKILQALCVIQEVPLAVSTLRGELADNEEWKVDPARAAIVVGTIDMIGSKLLFSGYGDGRYYRSHHAGLIGQDSLIVHDEAHLVPAFSDLLRAIRKEQEREAKRNKDAGGITRPVRVIELSATSRGGTDNGFELNQEDLEDKIPRLRLSASKRLYLHPTEDNDVVPRIVELSRASGKVSHKILIYVRSPETAKQVVERLARDLESDSRKRVALLTGTIRGYERDLLVAENPVYRAFLDHTCQPESPVYLVSTSAGEVGVDLDADHLVCDLTTLDALVQRIGRVNRCGGLSRNARIDVVGKPSSSDDKTEFQKAIRKTFSFFESYEEGVDVSPSNLRRLLSIPEAKWIEAAFSPKPKAPMLTDILLDSWSLSSVAVMPGRPEVAPFLHGFTHDPPETIIAWRQEIGLLAKKNVDEEALSLWFRACRTEARERLRDVTDRVKKGLESLLKEHRQQDRNADFPIVIFNERGEARWYQLSEILGSHFSLAYKTVILPAEVGGLDQNGMLNPKAVRPLEGVRIDVAEDGPSDQSRQRWLRRGAADDTEHFERLLTGEISEVLPDNFREKTRISIKQPEEGEIDAERVDLVLLVSPGLSALENPETVSIRQTLVSHTQTIAETVGAIACNLGLTHLQETLVTAARWHDRGKDRPVWQRYARNDSSIEPLAKATRYLHPRALGGYRHEFGSLLEAMEDDGLKESADRNLALHLIAAHHGWARPHFDPRAYDNARTSSDNQKAACEVMGRFGRLQEQFGRWGLAWLESLVRCADIASSRSAIGITDIPSEFKEGA